MLQSLHIQNYAIIDKIDIDFSNKLNIITGETGAGKSILMGALSLILGERADSSALLRADKKCIIEGVFKAKDKQQVIEYLQSINVDIEEELVLRREIATNGKSRAFINDTPATLQQMKALASLLVDLHRQFDTLELSESNFQREVLDGLANQMNVLKQYKQAFLQWQKSSNELKELQEQKNNFNKEFDYHKFLFDELNELSFKEDELETLDQELKLLSNAESIKSTLTKVHYDLRESEQPIVQGIKTIANQLSLIAAYHKDIQTLTDRLLSTQIELQDIASEVERINDETGLDQQRTEWINERISVGFKLLKKHGVKNTNELLQIQNHLEEKLQAVLSIDDMIVEKEKETLQLLLQAKTLANTLSEGRYAQINDLEEKVNALLIQVGMPNARLKVSIKQSDLHITGTDEVEFLFDANKSNRFESIRKVASGGELSRLMLCIKSLVAQSIDLPTLIFDEIDTGISGEAAKQVGFIMKDLAASRQVLCITHQPQIAGKANAHFFVYKEEKGEMINTSIRVLTKDERINAIAQMLSGEKPTAAALENARELIVNN